MEANITESSTSSAQIVLDSINDFLILILLCLPVKSLMRFKAVSKRWKSVITSSRFVLLRNPNPNPVLGFIYPDRQIPEKFEYISLDVKNVTNKPTLFRQLTSSPDEPPCAFWIQHSCNGLLLCCCASNDVRCAYYNTSCQPYVNNSLTVRKCYVYNPTTGCYTKLPTPGVVDQVQRSIYGVNLAFDHGKSIQSYKVVCVRESELSSELFQIEIYSSQSGVWRVSGEPFSAHKLRTCFHYGVYWNGSINWISHQPNELYYFNVDKEILGKMLLPDDIGLASYFGESCDHLHIVADRAKISVNVYEINKDYSECFVKYRVDLTIVLASYPIMAIFQEVIGDADFLMYSVISLIRNDENEGALLVLKIFSKVVVFNVNCNTLEEIYDFGRAVAQAPSSFPCVFGYIESLACV